MEHMVRRQAYLNSNAQCWYATVSLALVPCLVDNQKYYLPGDLPPDTDPPRYKDRGPRLETLVRLVVQCDSAEQRGRELKRRLDCFDPKQRRERARVLVAGGMSQTEAAIILGVGKATISRDLAELEHSIGKV